MPVVGVEWLQLVLGAHPEGGYTVTCPLLPELITEGDTVREALVNAQKMRWQRVRKHLRSWGDLCGPSCL
jgi:hypothetical protein